MILSLLLPFLAQVGPSVGVGAGGSLPQAPLEIPRKKAEPTPPPVPLSAAAQCRQLLSGSPAEAQAYAESWLKPLKGSARAEPGQCLGMALAAQGKWDAAEAAFSAAREVTPASEPGNRARLGGMAGNALLAASKPEAALARPATDDPRVAERFELYACGVELANGFGELTNAPEQRRRFAAEMDEKERVYGERYPLDEDFLQALALMPPSSGIALGFDRLVMLATGAPRIDDVIWTPVAG